MDCIPEEKTIGNEFEVNVSIAYSPPGGTITGLEETVNYAAIYDLLKSEMQKPRELLETLVMEIAEQIHHSFPIVKRLEIGVTKLNPPIEKYPGTVGVNYTKEY